MRSARTTATVATSALIAASVLIPAGVATAAPARHQSKATVIHTIGGYSALKLDANTAKALTAAGFTITPTGRTHVLKSGALAFPIVGGKLNTKTMSGYIAHTGGIKISLGKKSLTLDNFRINPAKQGLSARIKQAGVRLRVFSLNLKHATASSTKHALRIAHVRVTLAAKAAKALDKYFDTTAFKPGTPIGTARIDAHIRITKK